MSQVRKVSGHVFVCLGVSILHHSTIYLMYFGPVLMCGISCFSFYANKNKYKSKKVSGKYGSCYFNIVGDCCL